MMAPLPTLLERTKHADEELPDVRLDARVGTGKAVSYPLGGEFLIGGAEGCDLQLPGSHLPAVIGQFTRSGGGVVFRRLAPSFAIMLNGQPLPHPGLAEMNPGDRVTIGSADIVVSINGKGYLRPGFVPVNRESAAPPPREDWGEIARERASLEKLRATLTLQAQELEADRVAWYRRRQEIDAEVRRLQESVTAGSRQANREQWLSKREAEIQAKEAELFRVRQELSDIRENLIQQYQERRQQLEELQKAAENANDTVRLQEQAREEELARRRAELEDKARQLQDEVEAEVARRMETLQTEYRRRAMELEVNYDRKLRELDEEVQQRRQKFTEDITTLEPRLAALEMEKLQLDRGFRELTYQKELLETQRAELNRDWQAREAEHRWNEERRLEREALLAAREAETARQTEANEAERRALAEERENIAEKLIRLQNWQASADERQNQLDERAAEIDLRMAQLARDAAEWEESLKQAELEQERLTQESDRLERLKASLDERAAQLAERASQIEAQQAGLMILRAKIDRQQHEIERESAALAADRARLEQAQAELDHRLRDTEYVRANLTTAREERQELDERTAHIDATLAELNAQRETLAAEAERLKAREQELDARSTDLAEQTAVFTAKTHQVIDLQQRLEADRAAVEERERAVQAAEQSRAAFQEQLKKRSDDLAVRSRELDDLAARYSDERISLNTARQELNLERGRLEQSAAEAREELARREEELTRQAELICQREQSLDRQVARLRAVGQSVAAGRKSLYEARKQWESEQAELLSQSLATRRELEEYRVRAAREIEELSRQSPQLEARTQAALEKLASAREMVRSQLVELHDYAGQSRQVLNAIRTELREEAERMHSRERELEQARVEHRAAVAEFRQQLQDWQSRVASLKSAIAHNELRIEQREAELVSVSRKTHESVVEIARRVETAQAAPDEIAERRIRAQQHLAAMREWFRKKFRDLASAGPSAADSRVASPRLHAPRDIEPGDRQLGELLQSLELLDASTLTGLYAEGARQRRTLRQLLLTTGTVTLYQLALIEARNLEALIIDRFRAVDRVRVSPREAVYRVFDPQRAQESSGGQCVLRVLSDAEMHDAMHPDEYRQRFALAAELDHPHVARTLEVLEVHGRPAAVQEWVVGVPSTEWPNAAAMPGVWLRLLIEAASALHEAHQRGLVHGRLKPEQFLLTPAACLKICGFGEPPWLATGMAENLDPSTDYDLLALGSIAQGWSQLAGKKKQRVKPLPDSFMNVLRRLGSDANAFDDAMTGPSPFRSAEELLEELHDLQARYPCSDEMWSELVEQLRELISPPPSRKTA